VALYPRLVPALFEAESGVLTGPIEVDGGWSLFRLAQKDEGGIEPFASARRRARALLLRQRQQDALGSFLRQLRVKYRDRVEIHEDLLIEALPDEVL
jgi:parvulin-like peptidyl-prolyl isomerase